MCRDMGINKVGPRQACNTPGPCDDEQADEEPETLRGAIEQLRDDLLEVIDHLGPDANVRVGNVKEYIAKLNEALELDD